MIADGFPLSQSFGDLGQVWPDLALTAAIGAACFAFGLARFRRAMVQAP